VRRMRRRHAVSADRGATAGYLPDRMSMSA